MVFKDRLSVTEVSNLLDIPRSSVFHLIQKGGLPAYKFRGKVFVNPADLKEYIEKETKPINNADGKITIN